MKQHKQTNTITTFNSNYENPYGQFIALSDQNEIMCYSRNGTAIYYAEDPPVSPMKNKQLNPNRIHVEKLSIPRYQNYVDMKPKISQTTFGLMYGLLITIFFLIVFSSIYIILFDK